MTVRVPNNPCLQHVTLVDLPGNGDRNKSRDTMWKKVIYPHAMLIIVEGYTDNVTIIICCIPLQVVGSCSTVWIVAEINRAASEKESWEILEESCSLMGNGGECQQIHFICTKSDHFEDSDDQ